ncbi:hypothetical protein ACFL08_03815 [Patescibacteria group bacterium]
MEFIWIGIEIIVLAIVRFVIDYYYVSDNIKVWELKSEKLEGFSNYILSVMEREFYEKFYEAIDMLHGEISAYLDGERKSSFDDLTRQGIEKSKKGSSLQGFLDESAWLLSYVGNRSDAYKDLPNEAQESVKMIKKIKRLFFIKNKELKTFDDERNRFILFKESISLFDEVKGMTNKVQE